MPSCGVAKQHRTQMLAKLSKFCEELLKHPEYHAIVFVLHDGAVSGFSGHFVRSRMFYTADNSAVPEMDKSTVAKSPVRKILCGIARLMEDHHNSDQWTDPRVTVCAFTSSREADQAIEATNPGGKAIWVYEPAMN